MKDVLSGVAKNGMGCFVPRCFILHSILSGRPRHDLIIVNWDVKPDVKHQLKQTNVQWTERILCCIAGELKCGAPVVYFHFLPGAQTNFTKERKTKAKTLKT